MSPARGSGQRRTAAVVVGSLAVLAVLGGGALAATKLLGSDSLGPDGQPVLGAVTAEPERGWTWRGPSDSYLSAQGVDQGIVASSSDPERTWLLDDEGEEQWSAPGSLSLAVPKEDLLIVSDYDDYMGETEFRAIAAADGSTRWRLTDVYPYQLVDGGLLGTTEDGEAVLIDVATGEEKWRSSESGMIQGAGDGIYEMTRGKLARLSMSDGSEEWSIGVPGADPESEDTPGFVTTDGMVVVGGSEATAYSEDGEQLWTAPLGGGGYVQAEPFGPGRVFLETGFSVDGKQQGAVYDTSGKVGDLAARGDSGYVGFTPFDDGGTDYALTAAGEVYDMDLQQVGRYDGLLYPVDGGVYAVDGGEVSFYEVGENRTEWSQRMLDDEDTFVPVDEGLVVISGDELTYWD